jgi:uncharacterized protein
MTRALTVNAVELLRRPGTEREMATSVAAADIGLDDPRLAPGAEVAVALRLESLSDGIVVTGSVAAPWHLECRRCLAPLDGVLRADVGELFQLHVVDPDATPIVGDVIDLAPVLREILLVELPAEPTCRPDCAGLCPVCGADRNTAACRCDDRRVDDRWSVLDQLKDIVGDD